MERDLVKIEYMACSTKVVFITFRQGTFLCMYACIEHGYWESTTLRWIFLRLSVVLDYEFVSRCYRARSREGHLAGNFPPYVRSSNLGHQKLSRYQYSIRYLSSLFIIIYPSRYLSMFHSSTYILDYIYISQKCWINLTTDWLEKLQMSKGYEKTRLKICFFEKYFRTFNYS